MVGRSTALLFFQLKSDLASFLIATTLFTELRPFDQSRKLDTDFCTVDENANQIAFVSSRFRQIKYLIRYLTNKRREWFSTGSILL